MTRHLEKQPLDLENIRRGVEDQQVIRQAKNMDMRDIPAWPEVQAMMGDKILLTGQEGNTVITEAVGVKVRRTSAIGSEGKLILKIIGDIEKKKELSPIEKAIATFEKWNTAHFQTLATESDLLDCIRIAGNLIDEINKEMTAAGPTDRKVIWQAEKSIQNDENLIAVLSITEDGILDFEIH